jgi:hypothetical protein
MQHHFEAYIARMCCSQLTCLLQAVERETASTSYKGTYDLDLLHETHILGRTCVMIRLRLRIATRIPKLLSSLANRKSLSACDNDAQIEYTMKTPIDSHLKSASLLKSDACANYATMVVMMYGKSRVTLVHTALQPKQPT